MDVVRYSVRIKDVPGKEWSVTFGSKQNKACVIKKFKTLYSLPIPGGNPLKSSDFIIKELPNETALVQLMDYNWYPCEIIRHGPVDIDVRLIAEVSLNDGRKKRSFEKGHIFGDCNPDCVHVGQPP